MLSRYKETSSAEILRRKVPVRNVPERFDELRTRVAIVDVIRVFPHVDGQQRLGVGGQRRSGIAGRHDVEGTGSLIHEPRPARTERAGRDLGELFLELVEGTVLGVDRVAECAGRSAATLGRQAVPEERVIPDLR